MIELGLELVFDFCDELFGIRFDSDERAGVESMHPIEVSLVELEEAMGAAKALDAPIWRRLEAGRKWVVPREPEGPVGGA